MNNTVVFSILYFLGIGLLLGLNEVIYQIRNIKGEYTRKVAHIIAIFATLPLPFIFTYHGYVLILALVFFAILLFSQNNKQLKSIHDIDRKSVGSYLMPLSIYVTFCISAYFEMKTLYLLPMIILGVCDPIAALVGMNVTKYNKPFPIVGRFLNKSIMGSLGFFISSFIICAIVFNVYFESLSFGVFGSALIVAIAGTLGELISWNGTDNLTIPMSTASALLFLL